RRFVQSSPREAYIGGILETPMAAYEASGGKLPRWSPQLAL
ncbi:MAG: hypothetical protein JWL84_4970, partial [Rhodospirillales bacterium]|nr:hypothetical protein [Rhodospirillales bacterium]